MARAQGRAQMALAFGTTYGTPPPALCADCRLPARTLGSEQPLLNSELLGYGAIRCRRSRCGDGDGNVVCQDCAGRSVLLRPSLASTITAAPDPYTNESLGGWTLPSCRSRLHCRQIRALRCIRAALLDTALVGRCRRSWPSDRDRESWSRRVKASAPHLLRRAAEAWAVAVRAVFNGRSRASGTALGKHRLGRDHLFQTPSTGWKTIARTGRDRRAMAVNRGRA